jgi:ParB family transcriptional regulator, chromosome partitioning protein
VNTLQEGFLTMKKRKAFGISQDLNDGISETMNAAKNNAGQLHYEVIPLTKIKFDPDNPRQLALKLEELTDGNFSVHDSPNDQKRKELESLKSLASSIKKSGVRNAIEVYKDGTYYRLISGERRVLGSILAGKEDIPARILATKPTLFDIRYLQWIENIEREDLSISERIHNVRQLVLAHSEQGEPITATRLKELLGCSLPHAMTYLAILHAPSDIQTLLMKNAITNLEKAAFLAKVDSTEIRAKLVQACLEEKNSLAKLKKLLNENVQLAKKSNIVASGNKGRIAKRVTLGYTQNIDVVKKLIDLILAEPHLQHIEQQLHIDWQDCTSISRGFQALIQHLEKEINLTPRVHNVK